MKTWRRTLQEDLGVTGLFDVERGGGHGFRPIILAMQLLANVLRTAGGTKSKSKSCPMCQSRQLPIISVHSSLRAAQMSRPCSVRVVLINVIACNVINNSRAELQ